VVGPAIRELIDELKGNSRDIFIPQRSIDSAMTTNEWLETGSQSISSGAQYVTLSSTNAFHIQVLVIYFFLQPHRENRNCESK
jgi:hypothetical protein